MTALPFGTMMLVVEAAMSEPNCVWCQRLARNGCEPEVCGHLGSSFAEAAQRMKEEGLAREREKRRNASTIPAGDVDAILDCLLGGEFGAAS